MAVWFPAKQIKKSREPEALRVFFSLRFAGLPTDVLALSGMCWPTGAGRVAEIDRLRGLAMLQAFRGCSVWSAYNERPSGARLVCCAASFGALTFEEVAPASQERVPA